MKGKEKKILIGGASCLVAFVIWTWLVQSIDVKTAPGTGTEVGFAAFIFWFHELTGVYMTIYNITDWLGLVPVFVCMAFGILGMKQMIKRKKLLKVDLDLILLGIYYVLVIGGYLIFEMIPINYRPILIEGRLEASYPSSTTLLVLSVMPTLYFQAEKRFQNVVVKKCVHLFTILFSAFMVVGRMISGVHWFTDIVGAGFLSTGLFCIYKSLAELWYQKR